MKVELDPQVASFLRSLAPEPRKQIRAALRGLEDEAGDLKVLEDELAGLRAVTGSIPCTVLRPARADRESLCG